MCVCGAAGGALWALIPGALKAFARTNEIITTLMLNYVAGLLLTYLIFDSASPWRDLSTIQTRSFPQSIALQPSQFWPTLTPGDIIVPFGFLLAIGVAIGLWVLFRRTRFGFEMSVLGDSNRAARYSGMRTRRKILAVMAISGGLAGLGGASQVGDFRHQLDADPNGMQRQFYGYSGIVVAALARYNPLAVLPVAFLIGGLQNAGNTLQGADFPSGLVGVIQGIILFSALGFEIFARYRIRVTRRQRAGAAPAPETA
jgi:simple sugar transport system permease protein